MSQEQEDRVQQQEYAYIKNEETQDASAPESNVKEGEVYIDVPAASGKKRKKMRFR